MDLTGELIRLVVMKRFFTEKLAGHWIRLLRAVVMAPSLLVQIYLDNALRHRVWFLGGFCVEPGVGLDHCDSLQTEDILWFYKLRCYLLLFRIFESSISVFNCFCFSCHEAEFSVHSQPAFCNVISLSSRNEVLGVRLINRLDVLCSVTES